jgi:hypothetical protein
VVEHYTVNVDQRSPLLLKKWRSNKSQDYLPAGICVVPVGRTALKGQGAERYIVQDRAQAFPQFGKHLQMVISILLPALPDHPSKPARAGKKAMVNEHQRKRNIPSPWVLNGR